MIPVGVVAALIAIAAVAPAVEEQPEVATESEITASAVTGPPVVSDSPVVTDAAVATVAPTTEAPVVTAPAPVRAPATTATPVVAPVVEAALMPNAIGMNLQDAQDLIQEQGVFLSLSEDATGQGRNQLLDRNWVVIGQNIEPGQPFGEGDAVLSVVKYTD